MSGAQPKLKNGTPGSLLSFEERDRTGEEEVQGHKRILSANDE